MVMKIRKILKSDWLCEIRNFKMPVKFYRFLIYEVLIIIIIINRCNCNKSISILYLI